jgi:HlyD family secretion protein
MFSQSVPFCTSPISSNIPLSSAHLLHIRLLSSTHYTWRQQVNWITFLTRNRKTIIGGSAVLILVTIFAFVIPHNIAAVDSTYQTEEARRGSLSSTAGATGTLRAYQSVKLAWQTSGIVATVDVNLGDSVKAGDVLANLDLASLQKTVILAEADLVSAQRTLENLLGSAETDRANAAIALRDAGEAYDDAVNYREMLNYRVDYDVFVGFNRIQTPMGSFKVPDIRHIRYYPGETQKTKADEDLALKKAQLEDAQRAYDRLKDGPDARELAAAQARVAAARATLGQAKLIAPFDGVVTDASILTGDQVTAGENAFQVDDLSRLMIDLEVSEVDINNVAVGQKVTVDFDAIQRKDYQGVVVEVAGAGTPTAGSVNFRVTVELMDADELVKPGMTAAVLIQIRNVEDALLVPNRAIRMVDGKRVAYVLKDDGSLITVEVRLGATSDSYSEVVGGNLKAGDSIVLNPPAIVDTGSGIGGNTVGG